MCDTISHGDYEQYPRLKASPHIVCKHCIRYTRSPYTWYSVFLILPSSMNDEIKNVPDNIIGQTVQTR